MFWDNIAFLYDMFENVYNGNVNREFVNVVIDLIDDEDRVLECACGTGMISKGIALKCKELVATDFSDGMLKQAKKNLSGFSNVKVQRENIMCINCKEEAFDKVIAGNVIHLLDEPYKALDELLRCCKSGGKVIIPTYVNKENVGKTNLIIHVLEKLGADFKKQFDYESYKNFYKKTAYSNVEFKIVNGRMPCAIAIITKE